MRSLTTATTASSSSTVAAPGRDGRPAAFHGLLRPVPAGGDPRAIAARGEPARSEHPLLAALRVWVEPVRGARGDAAAEARRVRELSSPVSQAAPVRAVVLAYADGTADLVVVADRAVLDRAGLAALATLLIEPERLADRAPLARRPVPRAPAPPPAWGLGDPAQAGRAGRVDLPPLPAPATPLPVLVAATAIAAARYDGAAGATVGVVTDDLPGPGVATLRVEDEATAASVVAAAGGAVDAGGAAELPAVGIALSSSRREGERYDPGPSPLFGLTLTWELHDDAILRGTCRFDLGACDAAVAAQFARHVGRLAARLQAAPAARLGDLELLDEREREAVVALGRTPAPSAGPARTIDEAIAAVARTQPDAPAVSDGDRTLTYAQLDARGEAVAAGLRRRGVRRGARVGVCVANGADLVATLLGVLRTGAAYVPMDPRYPAERLRYTVEDAGVAAVVSAPAGFAAGAGVAVLAASELLGTEAAAPREAAGGRSPEDAAYVIYTSGSTGRPKGVVVRHRNVTALLDATAADMALGPADVWTAFHSSAFDFSVWEIWGCLLTGGHLVTVPHAVSRSPEAFHDLLTRRGVTVLSQTPSAFAQLVDVERRLPPASSVRLAFLGGEPLDVATADPWLARHPRCRLVNMYGITETTVHVTAQTVTAREVASGSRSVGPALPGWSVSVRDERGRPQPIGVSGEIYVGGAGVASHYLNHDDLTAQRFVVDPVSGERLYRSGDRGRLRPDGSLDHLGRLDSQVKLRGHRIELGEIRSVLLEDARVTAAAVRLSGTEHRDPALLRLDAYVVLAGGSSPAEQRSRLSRLLPDYMVPSTVTALPALPLTVNGKLDVERLPDPLPAPAAAPARDDDADGALVAQVLRGWRQVFGEHVTAGDDFFALGGNSLIAVRLAAVLRDAGLPRVALRDLFLHPTAKRLATALADSAAEAA